MQIVRSRGKTNGGIMKIIYAVCILITLVACNQLGSSAGKNNEYQKQEKVYYERTNKWEEQQVHYDQQAKKADEQAARYDKLLDRWEKQADRLDAILDKLEKQTAKSK
jgi:hypothetical protein